MVGDTCLCLHIQRASRSIARQFDTALRPFDLTSSQFSLLMMLNRPTLLSVGGLARCLAMDRTTTTANLKPLRRRGLLMVRRDGRDARAKQVALTARGRSLLVRALTGWHAVNDAVRASIKDTDHPALYSNLERIAERGGEPG
jgi:DNA-binding MarR family transcriptional regulator